MERAAPVIRVRLESGGARGSQLTKSNKNRRSARCLWGRDLYYLWGRNLSGQGVKGVNSMTFIAVELRDPGRFVLRLKCPTEPPGKNAFRCWSQRCLSTRPCLSDRGW